MPLYREDELQPGATAARVPKVGDTYDPEFLSQSLPAAFRMENTIGSLRAAEQSNTSEMDLNFNPGEFMRPQDWQHQSRFVTANTHEEVIRAQRQIDREQEDRATLDADGWAGIGAMAIAGVLDPTLFVPVGGAAYRTYRVGGNILTGAARTAYAGAVTMTAAEAALHATQETRTLGESAANIAIGTLFSGVVGAGAAKLMARSGDNLSDVMAQIDADMTLPPTGGSASAARVGDLDDAAVSEITAKVRAMADEGLIDPDEVVIQTEIAKRVAAELLDREGVQTNTAVRAALKVVGRSTPDLRILQSDSIQSRRTGQELFETSLTLAKNEGGTATPYSAEAMIRTWQAPLYRSLRDLDDAYSQYVFGRDKQFGDTPRAFAGRVAGNSDKMSGKDFREAVGRAMRNGDDASDILGVPADAVAHVNRAAATFRKELFEPLKDAAIAAKLLPEDVEVDTAISYFSRVYNLEKLADEAHRGRFLETTTDWLERRKLVAQERAGRFEEDNATRLSEIKTLRQDIKLVEDGVKRSAQEVTRKVLRELTDDLIEVMEANLAPLARGSTPEEVAARRSDDVRRQSIREGVERIARDETLSAEVDDLGLFLKKALASVGEDDDLLRAIDGLAQDTRITEGGAAVKLDFAKIKAEAEAVAREAYDKALARAARRVEEGTSDTTAQGAARVRRIIAEEARTTAKLAAKRANEEAQKQLKELVEVAKKARRLHSRDVKESTMSRDENFGLAEEILGRIRGTPAGRLPYDVAPDKLGQGGSSSPASSGFLKTRAFAIDDRLIEEFLESDVEVIAKMLTRSLAPDIEITKKMGSLDMTDQLKAIQDDYNVMRRAPGGNVKALNKAEERDIKDLIAMRDRMLHQHGLPDDPASFVARGGRALRQLNYVRLLGGMTASALPDMARPVMVHGFGRVFGDAVVPLLTNFQSFSRVSREMRDFGLATDMLMNSRAQQLADVADDFGRNSKFERALGGTADTFGVVSLMAPWNTAWKQLSGVVTMQRIIRAIDAEAAGRLSKKEQTYLRAANIGAEESRLMKAQLDTHRQVEGGLTLSNGLSWTDQQLFRKFQASLNREVDRIIVTPGQDRAIMSTSSEAGRQLFQFKSFSIASTQRVMLSGLQQRDMAALNGLWLSIALGGIAASFKMWDAGRGDELKNWDVAKFLAEGVDRSGVTGWLFDANNMLEKATRGNLGVNSIIGGAPMSRYASRNWQGALLGPSFGTANTLGTVVGSAAETLAGGDDGWRSQDTRALRRLLPYQNLMLLRRALDAGEAGINDSLGIR